MKGARLGEVEKYFTQRTVFVAPDVALHDAARLGHGRAGGVSVTVIGDYIRGGVDRSVDRGLATLGTGVVRNSRMLDRLGGTGGAFLRIHTRRHRHRHRHGGCRWWGERGARGESVMMSGA